MVTANKALLAAARASELFDAAGRSGVDLLYEAAVGGGIPLIRPLREHLAGDRIVRFMGIVNGTTNYILTRMAEDGLVLRGRPGRGAGSGYAEADPTADVEGSRRRGEGGHPGDDRVRHPRPLGRRSTGRGSAACRPRTSPTPRQLGYVVKLLAIAEA